MSINEAIDAVDHLSVTSSDRTISEPTPISPSLQQTNSKSTSERTTLVLQDMLWGDREVQIGPKRTAEDANAKRVLQIPKAVKTLKDLSLQPLLTVVDRRLDSIRRLQTVDLSATSNDTLCDLIAKVGGGGEDTFLPAVRIKHLIFGSGEELGRKTAMWMLQTMMNPFASPPPDPAVYVAAEQSQKSPGKQADGQLIVYQREYVFDRKLLEKLLNTLATNSVHVLKAETLLHALSVTDNTSKVSLFYHGMTTTSAWTRHKQDQDKSVRCPADTILFNLMGSAEKAIMREIRVLCGRGAWDDEDTDDAESLAIALAGPFGLNSVQHGGRTARDVRIPASRFPSSAALVEQALKVIEKGGHDALLVQQGDSAAAAVQKLTLDHVRNVVGSCKSGPRFPDDNVLATRGELNMVDIGFDGTFKQLCGLENWLTCVAGLRSQRIVNHLIKPPNQTIVDDSTTTLPSDPMKIKIPLLDLLPVPKAVIKEELDQQRHITEGVKMVEAVIQHIQPAVVCIITADAFDIIAGKLIEPATGRVIERAPRQGAAYLDVVGKVFEWEGRPVIPLLHPGYFAKMTPFQTEINRLDVLSRLRAILKVLDCHESHELYDTVDALDIEIETACRDLKIKVNALERLKNLLRLDDDATFAVTSQAFAERRRKGKLRLPLLIAIKGILINPLSIIHMDQDIQTNLIAVGPPHSDLREEQITFLVACGTNDSKLVDSISRPTVVPFGSDSWKEWLRSRKEGINLNLSIQSANQDEEQMRKNLEGARLARKEAGLARRVGAWSEHPSEAEVIRSIVEARDDVYHIVCGSCGDDTYVILRDPFRVTHYCPNGKESKCTFANNFFSEVICSLGHYARLTTSTKQNGDMLFQRDSKSISDNVIKQLGGDYIFVRDHDTGHIIAAAPKNPVSATRSINKQLLHAYALQCERRSTMRYVIASASARSGIDPPATGTGGIELPLAVPIGHLPIRSKPQAVNVTIAKTLWDVWSDPPAHESQDNAPEDLPNDHAQPAGSSVNRPAKRSKTTT